jgi:L-lactate dehydrogenase complex protein LldG
MSSRDRIIAALKANQPPLASLPELVNYEQPEKDNVKKFTEMLTFIGGTVIEASGYESVLAYIHNKFESSKRIIATLPELNTITKKNTNYNNPHSLDDVHLTILKAQFGVAENGAIWITDGSLPARALPFITEYLAIVLEKKNIVATMHDAYDQIGSADYGFGAFIAGPSKTSDIEQSLVLGAHGPKGMTAFLI